MSPEERIERYKAAYQAANGHFPYLMRYEGGWYRLFRNGFNKGAYRAKKVDELTAWLEWRASEDGQKYYRKNA